MEVWDAMTTAFNNGDVRTARRLATHYDSLCEETDVEFDAEEAIPA